MIKRFLTSAAIAATVLALAAAAWTISAPAHDWTIAGPFGGTATTVAIDPENPQVVLAGALNSLLYQSHDAGESWQLTNFPKRNLSEVSSILVDPSDSKHYLVGIIAAGGGGLLETHDGGTTWAPVKDIRDFGVRALTAAPSQPSRFVAGTLHGVMLSDDSGKTWTRISDPQNFEMQGITAVAVDPKDANTIYAGTAHLPWKTADGGKTWQSIHTGMIDDSDVFSIYVDPTDPNDILASACSGIYSSGNRGDLWRKLMGIPNTSRRTHVVREDPLNPKTIFAGTTTGLFKSLNAGGTWKTLTNTQVNALAFDPSKPQSLYLAMEYEGLGKSYDGGEAINPINKGFVDRAINSVTVSGSRLVALETQNDETSGIFTSADRGESWSQVRNTRGLAGVHLKTIAGLADNEKIFLAASSRQMYKSVDSGLTWKPIPLKLVIPPPPAPETPKAATPARVTRGKQPTRTRTARVVRPPAPKFRIISPSDISGLYSLRNGVHEILFAATDLGLLKTDDAGEQWTLADIPGSTAVTALYLSPNSNGSLVARTAAGLFMSKDCGDHWSPISFPLPVSDINDVALPYDSNSPLLVATRVGLYSSPDGGEKWYANLGGFPASTVNSVIYGGSENIAYAVEYGRLFETTDSGTTWNAVPSALNALWIRQLWMPDRASNRLFGITSDLGILFRN